jgi:hypothetical protein
MGKKYKVRATPEHVEQLIPLIPPRDNADMMRGWGYTSAEGLRLMFAECPDTWSIFHGDEIVAMFGCMEGGRMWLIRGTGMDAVAIPFIRQADPVIDAWLARYGYVEGFFSKDYIKLLRWVVWAGFEIEDLNNGYVRCFKWA